MNVITRTEPAEDARWQAVLSRDAASDGRFVYAVRTTGVYCRPTCPSRRGRRENVAFYDSCAAAEAAGYRPCRRCRPNEAAAPAASRHAAAVARACRMIEEAEEMPDLAALAAAAGLSPFHFHRVFKAVTGITPRAYGAARRARRLREELAQRDVSVTEAIYGAGFNSNSRFYAASNAMLGMTPTAYRRGGEDAEIRFAIGQSSLGAVLVATSDKGVCAIALGDDPEVLARDLQDRFPRASLVGDDPAFAGLVARVIGFVDAPSLGLDLPLDLRGTAFQQRVWQALREVPPGATVSYADLARRIGRPEAVRAVANACAANGLAIAVPCHRVVRRDGDLSGYRWGVERKRALLAREVKA